VNQPIPPIVDNARNAFNLSQSFIDRSSSPIPIDCAVRYDSVKNGVPTTTKIQFTTATVSHSTLAASYSDYPTSAGFNDFVLLTHSVSFNPLPNLDSSSYQQFPRIAGIVAAVTAELIPAPILSINYVPPDAYRFRIRYIPIDSNIFPWHKFTEGRDVWFDVGNATPSEDFAWNATPAQVRLLYSLSFMGILNTLMLTKAYNPQARSRPT
jgi:hypothetical protein